MLRHTIYNELFHQAFKTTLCCCHAAVVMYNGKAAAYGYNHFDSKGQAVHAETHAIMRFLKGKRGEEQCILRPQVVD